MDLFDAIIPFFVLVLITQMLLNRKLKSILISRLIAVSAGIMVWSILPLKINDRFLFRKCFTPRKIFIYWQVKTKLILETDSGTTHLKWVNRIRPEAFEFLFWILDRINGRLFVSNIRHGIKPSSIFKSFEFWYWNTAWATSTLGFFLGSWFFWSWFIYNVWLTALLKS